MTEFASDKLLLLPLVSAAPQGVVRDLEVLFVYSLIGRLALYTDIRCQDLATKADHVVLDPTASYDAMADTMGQIARECGARFLLGGSLTWVQDEEPSAAADNVPWPAPDECRVTLRLFDAQEHRMVAETPWACRAFEDPVAGSDTGSWRRPAFDLFCELVTMGFCLVQDAMGTGDSCDAGLTARPVAASYEALRLLIQADRLTGSPPEKIEAWQKAVQADPTLEAAYYHLGSLYKAAGDYRQSVAHYRKALDLSAGRSRVRALYATEAGVCCALLGEYDPAIQWWQRAIAIEPQYLAPYLNLAHHYEETDDLPRAEAYGLQALQQAPQDVRPSYSLARIYCKRADWPSAIAQYERQMACDGEDGWRHSDIATCYLQLGRMPEAMEHLQRAAALDPHGEAGMIAGLILSELSALHAAQG